jgi:predicted O-methyltransferase YrrM
MDERWTEVDEYLEGLLLPSDAALEAALRTSSEAGLPAIQVSPTQGKFLHLLARGLRARSVLEVGTLGGYSTIWLARALPPGGRLLSLELNPVHAELARRNLARAGVADRAEVRVGPALETLPQLLREGRGPFDLTFIDADKPPTTEYFDWAVRLSHPGSLIVVDNVVRKGAVSRDSSSDEPVRGIRRFLAHLAADRRVRATVLQTVGRKGYDGFALAWVEDPGAPTATAAGGNGERPGSA